MYRIVKKFKSLANGELPLDDISDWTIQNDEIDKFLFHTDGGYSKKELKKWDGMKKKIKFEKMKIDILMKAKKTK